MGGLLMNIVWVVVAIVILTVILKILKKSTKTIVSLIINAIIGAIVLWVISLFWPAIHVNVLSSLIVGFLGVPGVILVIILQLFF